MMCTNSSAVIRLAQSIHIRLHIVCGIIATSGVTSNLLPESILCLRSGVHPFTTADQIAERFGKEFRTSITIRRTSLDGEHLHGKALNRTSDPQLSMVRRFAKAIGISVKDLV